MKKIFLTLLIFAVAEANAQQHNFSDKYVVPSDTLVQQKLAHWQDIKFGLLMHWGTYSQWGIVESWSICPEDEGWTQRKGPYSADYNAYLKAYENLQTTFNPTHFDPDKWVKAAKDAGMKYVVFTTKHHDGFCMFDTKLSDFRITAPDVPFHANAKSNVTREVFKAFRKEGFGIGAYFSKADWHSPYYWSPNWPAHTRNPNYDTHAHPEIWSNFVAFTYGQIQELMSGYGPIDILWLDAGQVRPPDQDIQMDNIAAMARRYQPHLILVDRTVGGRYENYHTPEQEVPEKPLPYAWETCMCLGTQWSYKPNDTYKSTQQIIHLLMDIVAKGGNLLLNIGPQPDGQLPAPAVERLKEIGAWLKINGDAVYGTRPLAPYKDGQVVFTQKGKHVYGIFLPEKSGEALPAEVTFSGFHPQLKSKIVLLGDGRSLSWAEANGVISVKIPRQTHSSPPASYGFAFEMIK